MSLPEVVRTYQELLYPVILGGMSQHRFDEMAAFAASLPPDDDGPLARTVLPQIRQADVVRGW